VSEYCNANVWVIPDPAFGVAESAVTVTGAKVVLGTVQSPRSLQPLFALPVFVAYM
jgi:hypothetical protein